VADKKERFAMKARKYTKTLTAIIIAAVTAVSCKTGPDANKRPVNARPLEGTIWLFADQRHIWHQKFFAGGALLIIEETAANNNWSQKDSQLRFSINGGEISCEGEFLDAKTIKGTAHNASGETWEFGLTRSTDRVLAERYAHREIWESASPFPPFTAPLRGRNEVRVKNPNAFSASAGIRAAAGDNIAGSGIDLNIPASGYNCVFIPDGSYEIYFSFSNGSENLYQGDDFSLSGHGFEIEIVPITDGNYRIRRIN
jgi:hypothetical protein